MTNTSKPLEILGWLSARHLTSCSTWDPGQGPGHCDCGALQKPLTDHAQATARIAQLDAQLAKMLPELEHLREMSNDQHDELVGLTKRAEAAEVDAERYRLLRARWFGAEGGFNDLTYALCDDELDAAIDQARASVAQEGGA